MSTKVTWRIVTSDLLYDEHSIYGFLDRNCNHCDYDEYKYSSDFIFKDWEQFVASMNLRFGNHFELFFVIGDELTAACYGDIIRYSLKERGSDESYRLA